MKEYNYNQLLQDYYNNIENKISAYTFLNEEKNINNNNNDEEKNINNEKLRDKQYNIYNENKDNLYNNNIIRSFKKKKKKNLYIQIIKFITRIIIIIIQIMIFHIIYKDYISKCKYCESTEQIDELILELCKSNKYYLSKLSKFINTFSICLKIEKV